MDTNRDEWMSTRAYALWELAGKPDGLEHEHWGQASAEWDAMQQARTSTSTGAQPVVGASPVRFESAE